MEDRVIWIASRYGTFLVKSLYSILEPWDSPLFPSGSVWRSSAPHKVAFFAWEASWGKVLTLDQLQRRDTFWQRGIFCLFKAETVDHLLHCAKIWVLWNFLFSLFGMSWILVQWKILFLGGMGRLWVKLVKRLGKWHPYVYFGQYRRKEFVSVWERGSFAPKIEKFFCNL